MDVLPLVVLVVVILVPDPALTAVITRVEIPAKTRADTLAIFHALAWFTKLCLDIVMEKTEPPMKRV